MKVTDYAIKELNELTASDLLVVYNLILSLKDRKPLRDETATTGHIRTRHALKKCNGAFAEDILRSRNDRI
ncbi:MAG: hypothetical protein HZA20_07105 [Nitrospirae bacterium]|nr:hypothetical protein [Nitrospirota bacterium]